MNYGPKGEWVYNDAIQDRPRVMELTEDGENIEVAVVCSTEAAQLIVRSVNNASRLAEALRKAYEQMLKLNKGCYPLPHSDGQLLQAFQVAVESLSEWDAQSARDAP